MAKKKKRSVFPVYAAAIAWAVYAGRNPMFELKHLILCALLSIGVFFVASLIWKPKLVEIPEPAQPEKEPEPSPEAEAPQASGPALPRLRIFDTCANLIRTLPALRHDERKPEDAAVSPTS